MKNKFKHIIWDCDGCLIDSEIVACDVVAKCYTDVGYAIDCMTFIRRFAGKSKDAIAKIIEEEIGYDITAKIDHDKKAADMEVAFRTRLKPIKGVYDALNSLSNAGITYSIASGSSMERLNLTLEICDLSTHFKNAIFSSEMVKRGKPAPDVFLLAAKSMGFTPNECLVIGDSPFDVQGAKAAGMKVVAFLGATHCDDWWKQRILAEGPDFIAHDMDEVIRSADI